MDVSIIVPLFRGEKFLPQILVYIIQNYEYVNRYSKCDMELILVNDSPEWKIDAATVKTREIPVYVIENSVNHGIHYSRISGLQRATGKYILFLDQDDTIEENYIFSQLSKIGEADAIVCNGLYRGDRLIMANEEAKRKVQDNEYYFSSMRIIISPGQVLLSRESIPAEWGCYILKSNYCDDAFLWLLMKDRNAEFAINDKILYHHNETGENTSFCWKNNAMALQELYRMCEENHLLQKKHLDRLKETIDRRVEKHLLYAEMEELFRSAEAKKDVLNDYFVAKQCRRVAVYGYGVFGKKLVDLLKITCVEIPYVIDQNAETINVENLTIRTLQEELEAVDLIIVTTVWIYDSIRKELRKKVPCEIISMKQFLENI